MADGKSPYFKGAVWLGMVFMVISAGGMFGVLTAEEESFDAAPRWLVFFAIMMFFNAGVAVGLMDSGFNDYRESWWLTYLQGLSLISIPLILTMVSNWVAFGPGEREFSGGISIPFLSISFERINEIIGRAFFGIFALILDVALLRAAYQLITDRFKKQDSDGDSDRERLEKQL